MCIFTMSREVEFADSRFDTHIEPKLSELNFDFFQKNHIDEPCTSSNENSQNKCIHVNLLWKMTVVLIFENLQDIHTNVCACVIYICVYTYMTNKQFVTYVC